MKLGAARAAKPFMLLCNRQKMQKYYHISSVLSLPPQVGCRQREKNTKPGKKRTARYEHKVIVSFFGKTEPTLRILNKKRSLFCKHYVIVFVTTIAWR